MMKFFSKKVKYDGHVFDSQVERDRYIFLLNQQAKGIISDLELQKEFEIVPPLYKEEVIHLKTKDKIVTRIDERKAIYTCDFFYFDKEQNLWIIEEYKSPMTAKLTDYILRRKLIKHLLAKWNKGGADKQYKFVEVVWKRQSKKKPKTPKND